ncbi:MAG: recombination mediator RecR [Prevotellaceae bacterium]|jgi:recombination protein RecR|nr:recombination mediator RecR [Prevotellaceae bacterium]
MIEIPSKLLSAAVDEMASLPGVGRKTALRLALHLLKQPQENVERFGNSFIRMRRDLFRCRICHNVSDTSICPICSDTSRDTSMICVVESIREVMSIENTMQYNGTYHVLGGIISPIEGTGPSDLAVDSLLARAADTEIREVILALSTTMEGETTGFYLYKRLKPCNVTVSVIARGVSFGDEIEYADEITLGRSIKNRRPFELL